MTNVAKISRCIKDVGDDGCAQNLYYASGVGSRTRGLDSVTDGATGRGIGVNIRDAYSFICHNYNFNDGEDEIYLIGFSRGAFTVRCIAALIDDAGLLTKGGLVHLPRLYKAWKKQFKNSIATISKPREIMKECKRSFWPQAKLDDPTFEEMLTELYSTGLLRKQINIEACAVWDTVSAIGVPLPGIMLPRNVELSSSIEQKFPKNLRHAFHCLALNEERKYFKAVLWSSPHIDTILKQCWFVGSHSDVGGGGKDQMLSTIPFLWMISQLTNHTSLCFDSTELSTIVPSNSLTHSTKVLYYSMNLNGPRVAVVIPWKHEFKLTNSGKIYRSKRGLYRFAGAGRRLPGSSAQPLRSTGEGATTTASPASNTSSNTADDGINTRNAKQEFVHWTVRVLMAQGFADCQQLNSWSTAKTDGQVFWVSDDSPAMNRFPEHEVNLEERSLLTDWLQAAYEKEKHLKSTTAARVHAKLVAGETDESLATPKLLGPALYWTQSLFGARVRHRIIAPDPAHHTSPEQTIQNNSAIITQAESFPSAFPSSLYLIWRGATSSIILSVPGTPWSISKTIRLPILQTLTQFKHRTIVDVLWNPGKEITQPELSYIARDTKLIPTKLAVLSFALKHA